MQQNYYQDCNFVSGAAQNIIYLLGKVWWIGDGAFAGSAKNVFSFQMKSDNKYFDVKYDAIFTKDISELIALSASSVLEGIVADNLKTIGPYALYDLDLPGKH